MTHDPGAHESESKSVRVLDALAASEPDGMSFGEVQWLAWGLSAAPSDGLTCSVRLRSPEPPRGYWCEALLGNALYRPGLLRCFAYKGDDGRWHRNDVPHEGAPWSVIAAHAARSLGDRCIQSLRDAGHTVMVGLGSFDVLPAEGSTVAAAALAAQALGFRIGGEVRFRGNLVGVRVLADA